jgi:catechol 2,3-dioxygenase-like lactoylglutathione lyase family enzyme
MPNFPNLGHVAVTVRDLSVSTAFYGRLFGVDPVLDEDEPTGGYHHVVFPIGDGMLFGLHCHPNTSRSGEGFNEFRPGLDHVAFACADRTELEEWQARLDGLGVRHGGIVDAHYGSGLSFRDPDGIALEFFAPPSR